MESCIFKKITVYQSIQSLISLAIDILTQKIVLFYNFPALHSSMMTGKYCFDTLWNRSRKQSTNLMLNAFDFKTLGVALMSPTRRGKGGCLSLIQTPLVFRRIREEKYDKVSNKVPSNIKGNKFSFFNCIKDPLRWRLL